MKLQKYREDMIYLSVLRPQHWYKNLLVFLPVIFSLNLLDTGLFFLSLQGFILFCLVSGCVYIINDITDIKIDKLINIKLLLEKGDNFILNHRFKHKNDTINLLQTRKKNKKQIIIIQ